MGAAFDRWLAKPTTLRFLRHLLAADSIAVAQSRPTTGVPSGARSKQRSYATEADRRDGKQYTRRHQDPKSVRLKSLSKDQMNPSETGLQMTLNSGVSVLDASTTSRQSFSQLRFQSDVNSATNLGKLLVDLPQHRDNAKLWVELLLFRKRIDGFDGIRDVWYGMRRREVDLPVESPEANTLWTTFVHACISAREEQRHTKGQHLLHQILKHAKESKARGTPYSGLYKCVVGRYFHTQPSEAEKWHKRLESLGLATSQDLISVISGVMQASSPDQALQVWLEMQDPSDGKNLYDVVMGELISYGDYTLQLRAHNSLLGIGYSPSEAMAQSAAMKELLGTNETQHMRLSPGKVGYGSGQQTFKGTYAPFVTRADMNTFVGDAHGIKPKEISDSFCAKLVATRAFSIDLITRGLSFLNIDALGPLTIRELVLRSSSLVAFYDTLSELSRLGINYGNSMIARLATKAATDGDNSLWSALVRSDQHPDVFEDYLKQDALFDSFLEQKNLPQAYLCLTAMSLYGMHAAGRGYNRLLQHQIMAKDYHATFNTMKTIRNQGIYLSLQTLAIMRRYLLPTRRPGRRPSPTLKAPYSVLHFVRNACIYTAEKGRFVPVNLWVELLKQYGMTWSRWSDTEALVYWLFNHYATRRAVHRGRSLSAYRGERRVSQRALHLRLIFSPQMLQAIFTWGFRQASVQRLLVPHRESESTCEEWARGLVLLKQFPMNTFDVKAEARTAFQQRLWILFSPAVSCSPANNHSKIHNHISLAHYINHANEIWEGLIDWVDPELLQEDAPSDPYLMVQFFGSRYRTSLKLSEYADVEKWAEHLGRIRGLYGWQRGSIRARRQVWRHSKYRLLRPTHSPNLASVEASTGSPSDTAALKAETPPTHQSPSAHSLSWRQRPSPRYIPALP